MSSKNSIKASWSKRKIPHYSNSQTSWRINTETNGEFAIELEQKLEKRLKEYESSERKSRKERYAIFSQCFEEVILHHSTYANLLSGIKSEYEDCIDAVSRGEKEAAFLYRNLTNGMSGPKTLEKYQERIRDLEEKARIIRKNNRFLKKKLMKSDKEKVIQKGTDESPEKLQDGISSLVQDQFRRSTSKTNRECRMEVLKRYSPSEQTNVAFLNEELQRLQAEIQELVRFFDKRFKLRKTKEYLIAKLMEREKMKGELQEKWMELKERLVNLEARIEKEVEEKKCRKQLAMLEKPKKMSVAGVILMAMKNCGNSYFLEEIEEQLKTENAADAENDDPFVDQQHDEMVEYMEKFEQLFNEGNFEEAAMVASTSPQDILRTATTFQRFKEQRSRLGEKSPLLLYCEAIIVNCANFGQKRLSASESVCAVEKALEEGRQDLLVQWVSQNKLKCSEVLGETIARFCSCASVCTCGCYTLAEIVFREMKARNKVVHCLCRQGRLLTAVHYGRNVAKFWKADFMNVLRSYPTVDCAKVLLQVGDGYLSSPLCREECIAALVMAGKPYVAVQLLMSPRDRIRCSKMVAHIRPDDCGLWMQFQTILKQQGFIDAALDVVGACVLAEAFYVAQVKLSL